MDRTNLTFNSGGLQCAAWLYRPAGESPHPCVILAHGFGGIREFRLEAFAQRFVQAGLAAFVFDYRHFGASEGTPRQLLNIKSQLADWTAAVSYVRTLDGIDAERIALWGTSFSGGHVIEIAAQDHRIAALVAQVPFTDGLANLRATPLRDIIRLIFAGSKDEICHLRKQPPYYIKIVGTPGTLAAITSPASAEGYRALIAPDLEWQDMVAARIVLQVSFYRPIKVAARIQCPLLICVCDHDTVTPPQPSVKAAQLAPHGQLKQYHGSHFDIYVGELFERASTDQCTFLTHCLLEKTSL